jgi:hypothetical protein
MFAEISGFLFLFIIVVLTLATSRYGYKIFSDLDVDVKLQEINTNPQKFQTGFLLVIVEHIAIIALAGSLFIAFSSSNMILGIIWLIPRSAEGLIQIYNKRRYWKLREIAMQYFETSSAEKEQLLDISHSILKSKNSTFTFAQLLFSIGTLAYSILFAISGVVPEMIGWFGVVASIFYGLGNGLKRVKPNVQSLWNLGGLLIWVFEFVLGGWLLFSSLAL